LAKNIALRLPEKHCAFKGCLWTGVQEEERAQHLLDKHAEVMNGAVVLLPSCYSTSERVLSCYSEAIARKIRKTAPVANCSIDRRCLYSYSDACSDEKVQSLICFSLHITFCVIG
jgi:hypothetical protein